MIVSRKAKAKKPVTFALVRKLALALPGVEEGTSYGTPGFKVCGKFLTRLRNEDDSLVFKVSSIEEREFLIRTDPAMYFITEHYRDYPAVLVRLATVELTVVAQLLEESWRRSAPRKLIVEYDAVQSATKAK
jgi:hypothetical protein